MQKTQSSYNRIEQPHFKCIAPTPMRDETIRSEIIKGDATAPIRGKPSIPLLNTFGDPNSPQLPGTIADYLHRTHGQKSKHHK